MLKYTGPGCYRFLNDLEQVIYVGKSKNINRRFDQHFRWKTSHLNKTNAIEETARFEIIKTENNGVALDLEQYIINKYKPKYNTSDKDHNINSKVTSNPEYYESLEKWQLYYKMRDFDKDKIITTRRQNKLALIATFIFFIASILMILR